MPRYYVDTPGSGAQLGSGCSGQAAAETYSAAASAPDAPACRHCGGPTRFHSQGRDVTWFRCFACGDEENYSLTVVMPEDENRYDAAGLDWGEDGHPLGDQSTGIGPAAIDEGAR